jgi:uncharacterized membrane protein YphA (DoxX/SURF4 family)
MTINFSETKTVVKLIQPGRIIFALGIISLGILQFFAHDYVLARPPALEWPAWAAALPGKLAWAYLSGCLVIIAGLAIILDKKARLAALFIGILFLVYSFLLRHLTALSDTGNAYKSLALGGGAFIVAASIFENQKPGWGNTSLNNNLVLTGCIFISLFFFWAGIAHFKFDEFVINFIPAYIPGRTFWAYFCGVALLAGATGLLLNRTRRLAAVLSGFMILLWFILLHIPRTAQAPQDFKEWMGVFESFSFSGILFVLAGLSSKKT